LSRSSSARTADKAVPDKLTETFKDLDLRVRNSLADEDSPMNVALATLAIAHDDAGIEYLSIDDVFAALRAADVAIDRASLAKGIGRAGKRVTHRTGSGGKQYRLALRGRPIVEKVLGSGDLTILHVDGTTPRQDRRALGEVLGKLKGTVRVCDPYYGVRSLESLELIPKSADVRFLTGKTNESAAKLAGALKDFKRERSKVELRLANRPQDLHDRYVLSEAQLLLVGHGLKDIGNKESFVMALSKSLAGDLLAEVRRAFDEKWTKATPL
jgi:hypothetical protein